MKSYKHVVQLILVGLITASCSLFKNDPTMHSFSATSNPAEGGTISPSDSTFEEGTSVRVRATPTEGWIFSSWEGIGITASTTNPLIFDISEDTRVTGSFDATSSIYTMGLTVEDDENAIELSFGQNEDSTSGFDSDQDRESPPPPPQGTLHAYFDTDNMQLLKDYRNYLPQSIVWDLFLQAGSGDTITLSWSIDKTRLVGTLNLKNSSGDVNIDMTSQSNTSITISSTATLTIEYEYQESSN